MQLRGHCPATLKNPLHRGKFRTPRGSFRKLWSCRPLNESGRSIALMQGGQAMNDTAHRSLDSVDDALRGDHERLDAQLEKLESAISASSPTALEVLGPFVRALHHHMTWEDHSLFPAVKVLADGKQR